mmetsp:Transcript_27145/g.41302  ORF Transcript_27145/g.41302 Transcript_27145/m.41302 type:complete len:249 (+) Transcript_27145:2700-3446(+)
MVAIVEVDIVFEYRELSNYLAKFHRVVLNQVGVLDLHGEDAVVPLGQQHLVAEGFLELDQLLHWLEEAHIFLAVLRVEEDRSHHHVGSSVVDLPLKSLVHEIDLVEAQVLRLYADSREALIEIIEPERQHFVIAEELSHVQSGSIWRGRPFAHQNIIDVEDLCVVELVLEHTVALLLGSVVKGQHFAVVSDAADPLRWDAAVHFLLLLVRFVFHLLDVGLHLRIQSFLELADAWCLREGRGSEGFGGS